MPKLNAQQFCDAILGVDMAITSLKSCTATEVENEAAILRRAHAALAAAEPSRRSEPRETRRAAFLRRSNEILVARTGRGAE